MGAIKRSIPSNLREIKYIIKNVIAKLHMDIVNRHRMVPGHSDIPMVRSHWSDHYV